jgi:hypothetical protein
MIPDFFTKLGHVRDIAGSASTTPSADRILATQHDVQRFADEWQHRVPEVLWRWGDPSFAVALRRTLIDVVQSEQAKWAPSPRLFPASVDPDSVWATYY